MRTYKNISEDKRPAVLRQMSATSDIGVKERLSEVLSHYSSVYDIEIELQFDEGGTYDCDYDEAVETPPKVVIAVRAISPTWGPVEACFSEDEVPLLVEDLADDDLYLQALDDYNRKRSDELKAAKAVAARLYQKDVQVWKVLSVKHFVIVRSHDWLPVAVHRAISYKQASLNAGSAGYPCSEYTYTEVRRSAFMKMSKKLPGLPERFNTEEVTDVAT